MTLAALSLAWLTVGIVAGLLDQISHEDAEPTSLLRPAAAATAGAVLGGLLGNFLSGRPAASADAATLVGSLVGVVALFHVHAMVDRRLGSMRRRS